MKVIGTSIVVCIIVIDSMHSIGAMKVPFFKASLLRKLRAVNKRKSKYELSEWSKRTYTFYSELPL